MKKYDKTTLKKEDIGFNLTNQRYTTGSSKQDEIKEILTDTF